MKGDNIMIRFLKLLILITSFLVIIGRSEARAHSLNNTIYITNDDKSIMLSKMSLNKKERKIVFLTFDDGPSEVNTKGILEILTKNNIKASFFIIGKSGERNKEILKELGKKGMAVYPHSYSHEYEEIYKNTESYFKDLNLCEEVIKKHVSGVNKPYMRMPGGSANSVCNKVILKSIKDQLREKNYSYIDWNVDSLDATSRRESAERIKRSVFKESTYNSISVVLFHDTESKDTTVAALEDVIKYYKNNNYQFKTLNEITQKEEKILIDMKVINR